MKKGILFLGLTMIVIASFAFYGFTNLAWNFSTSAPWIIGCLAAGIQSLFTLISVKGNYQKLAFSMLLFQIITAICFFFNLFEPNTQYVLFGILLSLGFCVVQLEITEKSRIKTICKLLIFVQIAFICAGFFNLIPINIAGVFQLATSLFTFIALFLPKKIVSS